MTLLLGAGSVVQCSAQIIANRGGQGTVLTGVVRDAEGVPQMGVLVQVLADGGAVRLTRTDDHGHYQIAHLIPGQYRVLATATMFSPAMRSAIDLGSNASTVINLTMSALFDTASWLPAARRRPNDPDDDWKWTLRSVADRPILHFAQDGTALHAAAGPEARQGRMVHGYVQMAEYSGGLEGAGLRETVALQTRLENGSLATVQVAGSAQGGQQVSGSALLEQMTARSGRMKTLVEYRSEPGLSSAGHQGGLQAFRVSNAQHISIGDALELDAGGTIEAVRIGSSTVLASHPFLQLRAQLGAGWKAEYRLATERGVQGSADVRTDHDTAEGGQPEFAFAIPGVTGTPILERGRHQEVSISHELSAGRLEVAYYHDALGRVTVHGAGAFAGSASGLPGTVVKSGQNSFARIVDGYVTDGGHIAYTAPLSDDLWIVAAYAVGDALTCSSGPLSDTSSSLRAHSSQAASVSIKGRSRRSGSQLRASYRWQPSGDISPVDTYQALSDQAFLSLLGRQQIRLGSWLPSGLEADIEISNLLAQGYRPYLSLDGHTLYLAQTPRTVQVGLAFNF